MPAAPRVTARPARRAWLFSAKVPLRAGRRSTSRVLSRTGIRPVALEGAGCRSYFRLTHTSCLPSRAYNSPFASAGEGRVGFVSSAARARSL